MAESRGMDIIRSNDGSILFSALLLDASGNPITTAGSLRIFHFTPTTGDIETYDFNDDTFKTGAVTTATTSTTHETGNNGTFDTGVHQVRHATLTDFTIGDKYFGYFTHASLPAPIVVEFQYGDLEGDQALHLVLRERETAQGGAATTITLNTNASSTNDFYNGQLILIVAGTGVGQSRVIRSYAGGTRIATVRTWVTNPDSTSEYVIIPLDDESTIDGIWDENIIAAHGTAASAGLLLNVLGGAISTRSFNPTLNALLGVPDTAGTDTLAGQVWEELAASHNTASTMGEIMNNISGGGFPTLAQIADAVWDEVLTSGHAVVGSAAVILTALNLTGRTNNGTLDALLGVPDVASATIAETMWDENITTHSSANTAGLALDAIGTAIAARANNATLAALLGVSDTPGHTIADPILDEVVDGSSHTVADSVGQRLTALDTLTEAAGAGDLADIRTQVRKIDQTAVSGSPAADSLADKLDTISATITVLDRDLLIALNLEGTDAHIEVAVEQFGVVQTSPWVDCAAQIYDSSGGGPIHNIGIADFGAISARGFFLFDIPSHALAAGNTYQIAVQVTDGALLSVSTTKPIMILQG